MRTTRQQARIAGVIYFVLGLIAPIGLLYVPGKLIVAKDAAATAANLRAFEGIVRLGIGSELAHQALVIWLVLALYRLFKPVDEWLAKQVVILGALVSVPIVFVNVLNEIAALTLAKAPPFLEAVAAPQRDALAYLFLRLHSQGITVASIFWGLWLFPFGLLVIRSRFIPKLLGVLLLVAGSAYVMAAFTTLVLPSWNPWMSKVALPLETAELPIIFWLLIWGARTERAAAPV
jgi:hypothetical protein